MLLQQLRAERAASAEAEIATEAPAPSEPAPSTPAPSEALPSEAPPSEPAPSEPAPSEPAPIESEPEPEPEPAAAVTKTPVTVTATGVWVEVRLGRKRLTFNRAKKITKRRTKLEPGSYSVARREDEGGPWQELGTVQISADRPVTINVEADGFSVKRK